MIKETGYLPGHNMRELIRDNAMLLPAISRFNIAFGFGDRTVEKICADNGVDAPTFLSVCNLLSSYKYDTHHMDLPTLIQYLRRAHTSFMDVALPRIRHHLIEAINYSETNETALLLIRFFDNYVQEVKRHMEYENDVIFKYVDSLLEGKIDPEFNISMFTGNHTHMASTLNELKDIFIHHYHQRDNIRLSAVLFDIITCEQDMMSHFEVENNLFLPAVLELEEQLKLSDTSESESTPGDADKSDSPLDLLSERERDIVREVARGKSNKEIADALFISVHTVATHRRNISAKLGIHSSAGLAIFAIINHLVDLSDISISNT